ncbi:glutamyl-tRNA(Gln) amidotransferase subunit A, chloroplastic/mitochondrial-like protein [Tanacetum coccineum]
MVQNEAIHNADDGELKIERMIVIESIKLVVVVVVGKMKEFRWLAAFASSLDVIGCFCTTVADVGILLQAISGHDKHDATSRKRGMAIESSVRVDLFG